MRYVYGLAERLHVDVDEILAWPWPKLQRWVAYDEVQFMLKAVSHSSPGITEAEAMSLIAWEQERCGWRGVYRTGQKLEDEGARREARRR